MGLVEEIKKHQLNTGTYSNEIEMDIEHAINNLFYLEKDAKNEPRFIKQMITRGLETQERKGLHASALVKGEGSFCYRQQVLSLFYKQLQGEQHSVKLMKIFEQGNAIHEKYQRLFIRGGLASVEDCDRTQLYKFDDNVTISFTPDIICVIDGKKYVCEIKSVNTVMFQKMVKEFKEHDLARKQVNFYMYLTGIHESFVLCEDKNTQQIKIFYYRMDDAGSHAEETVNRLKQISKYVDDLKKRHKLVKRHESCYSYNCEMAKVCPMKEVCYGKSKERI